MKRIKQFDCVQMKWDIQKKLEREFRGIPDNKANKIQMERLSNNSILGPLIKKIRLLKTA
ncbi:MAG: hypothetical protein KAX28_08645 [Candidatus Marinimicrobia bacterium]|nr:hypothetical protein [Candidatus Neomarinimicrobiota bacterium]